MKERNIHKGSVKLVLNSKSGLNSPTSALNSKKKKKKRKGKEKRSKIELTRLR